MRPWLVGQRRHWIMRVVRVIRLVAIGALALAVHALRAATRRLDHACDLHALSAATLAMTLASVRGLCVMSGPG